MSLTSKEPSSCDANLLEQTSRSSRHSRVRLLCSVALDALLTFAGPLTVAISEAIDSPSNPETAKASLESENLAVEGYPTVAEQLANQILGELNSAAGKAKHFSSGEPASCVYHYAKRCNPL